MSLTELSAGTWRGFIEPTGELEGVADLAAQMKLPIFSGHRARFDVFRGQNRIFDSIAERIYRFPQVRAVYLISGTYDLFVQVIGKSNREITDFVSQKLSHIDGVKETVTQFILKRYKEDGETIEGTEEIKRQAVVL